MGIQQGDKVIITDRRLDCYNWDGVVESDKHSEVPYYVLTVYPPVETGKKPFRFPFSEDQFRLKKDQS